MEQPQVHACELLPGSVEDREGTYSAAISGRTTGYLLRVYEGSKAPFGKPYVWWTFVEDRGNGVACMMGADRPIPLSASAGRAICEALKSAGFTQRMHERLKNGKIRRVIKSL